MKPYDYQVTLADDGAVILREHMMVYLAMEERTGKTLTSILIAESVNVSKVLVITKKKAMDGWNETLAKYKPSKTFDIINYHQAHKKTGYYDLVILDEAHNYISSFPKPGLIWKQLRPIVKDLSLIHI